LGVTVIDIESTTVVAVMRKHDPHQYFYNFINTECTTQYRNPAAALYMKPYDRFPRIHMPEVTSRVKLTRLIRQGKF